MNSNSDPRAAGAIAGIFGVVALALAPVWIGGQSFYHLDTFFEHVPFWHFAAESLANGDAVVTARGVEWLYPVNNRILVIK